MLFADLGLSEPILRAVHKEGYTTATPVQAQAIPHVLEGRDVLACAQTGTGKTAAFALPILHRLSSHRATGTSGARKSRCLVLCPTRELASQIAASFSAYGRNLGLHHTVVFGGVGQHPQVDAMRRGVEIIIATPGRLLDLMNQGHADLRGIEMLVLDEADRMLDMGFINDIRKIISKLSAARQTMLFSATMPREIRALASAILRDPVTVQVASQSDTADGIDESVYFVQKHDKPALLAHLVNHLSMARAIVFTRTKHGADRVVRQLHVRGIRAEAIHGNKTQNARTRAMRNFRENKTTLLVATDIASRGIDVDGITHVVNYDLTHEPETYVHRIGRTARAGASGVAVSFCDRDEVPSLRAIEKLIRRPIPVKNDQPRFTEQPPAPRESSHGHGGERGSQQRGSSERGSQQRGSSERGSQQRGSRERRSSDSRRQPSHPTGRGVVAGSHGPRKMSQGSTPRHPHSTSQHAPGRRATSPTAAPLVPRREAPRPQRRPHPLAGNR